MIMSDYQFADCLNAFMAYLFCNKCFEIVCIMCFMMFIRFVFCFRFVSYHFLSLFSSLNIWLMHLFILYLANVRLCITTYEAEQRRCKNRKKNPILCLTWQSFSWFYYFKNENDLIKSKQSGSGDFEF